jgi:hypothetical protein
MSDDRDLVGRLAAIDATPRASWVAELRADLDAAWGTGDAGYLDSLRTTTLTLVDDEPTPSEPSSGRRWLILIATAAAVVAAFALVATRDDQATPADQPTPTVTVPPTVPPRALIGPHGDLEPGTYFVDEVSGTPTPRIFLTVGPGWQGSSQEITSDVSGGWVAFARPDAVFLDVCHPSAGYHPGPVTTLDGLVTALSEQQGWAAVSGPSDISIDGYAGKAFRRTAPADMSDCDRDSRPNVGNNRADVDFLSWENLDGRGIGGDHYEPGTIETLRVVDIDGTVVVISTRVWGPMAERTAEIDAMLDSIRIERA